MHTHCIDFKRGAGSPPLVVKVFMCILTCMASSCLAQAMVLAGKGTWLHAVLCAHPICDHRQSYAAVPRLSACRDARGAHSPAPLPGPPGPPPPSQQQSDAFGMRSPKRMRMEQGMEGPYPWQQAGPHEPPHLQHERGWGTASRPPAAASGLPGPMGPMVRAGGKRPDIDARMRMERMGMDQGGSGPMQNASSMQRMVQELHPSGHAHGRPQPDPRDVGMHMSAGPGRHAPGPPAVSSSPYGPMNAQLGAAKIRWAGVDAAQGARGSSPACTQGNNVQASRCSTISTQGIVVCQLHVWLLTCIFMREEEEVCCSHDYSPGAIM